MITQTIHVTYQGKISATYVINNGLIFRNITDTYNEMEKTNNPVRKTRQKL